MTKNMRDLIPPLVFEGQYLQNAEHFISGKRVICPLCGHSFSKTRGGFKHAKNQGCALSGDTVKEMAFLRFMENAQRRGYVVLETVCPGALEHLGCPKQRPERIIWSWHPAYFKVSRERKMILEGPSGQKPLLLHVASKPIPDESTVILEELLSSKTDTIHVYQRCQTCAAIARAKAKIELAQPPTVVAIPKKAQESKAAPPVTANKDIAEVNERWQSILSQARELSTPAIPSPLTREKEGYDSFTWNLL